MRQMLVRDLRNEAVYICLAKFVKKGSGVTESQIRMEN